MDWYLIATGIAVGLIIAAPVGPINLMCVQRTLQTGFLAGVATGIGAAFGDGIFATIAAFGITWLTELIEGNSAWIQGVGGVLLLAMGARTYFIPPTDHVPGVNQSWVHHGGLVGTTFLLTITNPATLIGYIAVISGVKNFVAGPGDYLAATVLVASVMAGSFLWFIVVARVAYMFRRRFDGTGLKMINRASGVVIAAFGALVLIDLTGLHLIDRFM